MFWDVAAKLALHLKASTDFSLKCFWIHAKVDPYLWGSQGKVKFSHMKDWRLCSSNRCAVILFIYYLVICTSLSNKISQGCTQPLFTLETQFRLGKRTLSFRDKLYSIPCDSVLCKILSGIPLPVTEPLQNLPWIFIWERNIAGRRGSGEN